MASDRDSYKGGRVVLGLFAAAVGGLVLCSPLAGSDPMFWLGAMLVIGGGFLMGEGLA